MERYFLSVRGNRVFLVKTKIDDYSTFNPSDTDFQEIVYNYFSLDVNEKFHSPEIKSYTYITSELEYNNIKTIGYNFLTEKGKKQSVIIFHPFEVLRKEFIFYDIDAILLKFYTLIRSRRFQVYQVVYSENIENLLNTAEKKSSINFTLYNIPKITSFTLFVKYKNNQQYIPKLTKQLILVELLSNETVEIISDKTDKVYIFDNLHAKTNITTYSTERNFISLSTQESIHNNLLIHNYINPNSSVYTYHFKELSFSQYSFIENTNNQNITTQNYVYNNVVISSFITNELSL